MAVTDKPRPRNAPAVEQASSGSAVYAIRGDTAASAPVPDFARAMRAPESRFYACSGTMDLVEPWLRRGFVNADTGFGDIGDFNQTHVTVYVWRIAGASSAATGDALSITGEERFVAENNLGDALNIAHVTAEWVFGDSLRDFSPQLERDYDTGDKYLAVVVAVDVPEPQFLTARRAYHDAIQERMSPEDFSKLLISVEFA